MSSTEIKKKNNKINPNESVKIGVWLSSDRIRHLSHCRNFRPAADATLLVRGQSLKPIVLISIYTPVRCCLANRSDRFASEAKQKKKTETMNTKYVELNFLSRVQGELTFRWTFPAWRSSAGCPRRWGTSSARRRTPWWRAVASAGARRSVSERRRTVGWFCTSGFRSTRGPRSPQGHLKNEGFDVEWILFEVDCCGRYGLWRSWIHNKLINVVYRNHIPRSQNGFIRVST